METVYWVLIGVAIAFAILVYLLAAPISKEKERLPADKGKKKRA